MPVGLDQLVHIHEVLGCNLLAFNINDIPVLGHSQTLNICSTLVFTSEQKYKNTYYLLYDDVSKHYDGISNIEGFFWPVSNSALTAYEALREHKPLTTINAVRT